MKTISALGNAIKIRDFYNSLKIGHNGAEDCNWFVGPDPFKLQLEDKQLLMDQGELFRLWLQISLELCTRSLLESKFQWLADLIEGDIPEEVVQFHRRVHLSGVVKEPLFARPDMSAIGSTVEVQIPGSGWGYQTAIHKTVVENSSWIGSVKAFGQAIKKVTGSLNSPSAYILYNQPFFREVQYFCQCCNQAGMDVRIFFQSLPSPNEVKFLRRPPLQDLLTYTGGNDLLEAYLKGKLFIEPGPSLLFDQKLAIVFPFHPILREFYPDSIRKLFPETYLVMRENPPVFDNQSLSWDGLCDLSRQKRQFILKYAGAKKGLRAGGKAVYNLSDCNQKEVRELITRALEDWDKHRSPWLIQKRVKQKYPITFLNHNVGQLEQAPCYPLFRPMYSFLPNEPSQIVALTALFRKEWKIHGSSDAVMLPVEV